MTDGMGNKPDVALVLFDIAFAAGAGAKDKDLSYEALEAWFASLKGPVKAGLDEVYAKKKTYRDVRLTLCTMARRLGHTAARLGFTDPKITKAVARKALEIVSQDDDCPTTRERGKFC